MLHCKALSQNRNHVSFDSYKFCIVQDGLRELKTVGIPCLLLSPCLWASGMQQTVMSFHRPEHHREERAVATQKGSINWDLGFLVFFF